MWNLADLLFECYFTEVIPPDNFWWLSRSHPPPMSSFSKQIWVVLPLNPSKFVSDPPLLGSQLRLTPLFVLLKIKWCPLKSFPPRWSSHRRIAHVQHIKILSWLRGFRVKIIKFFKTPQRRLYRKEKHIKYWKMTRKPRSHVGILIYWT